MASVLRWSTVPDISAAVAPLIKLLAPLFGELLMAFLRTTVGMICLGGGLAVVAFAMAARVSPLHGLLAACIAVAACTVIGVILATKRAVGASLMLAVGELRLGKTTTQWLFAQMLGVDDGAAIGARGVVVATTLERLPLAQLEQRLAEVVDRAVAPDRAATGVRAWLQRKLVARLLGAIAQVTVSRFRSAAADAGGIDLIRVRDELAERMDGLVRDRIAGGTRKVTVLLVAAAVALAIGGAFGVSQLRW